MRTDTVKVLAVALSLLPPFAGMAPARADVLDTAPGKAAWTKTVGNLQVEKYGNGSPALILVPGLATGSWTWYDFISRESAAHAIYAVTIAGFAGVPPAADPSLDAADASILSLIQTEKIDRPVVIGHSLGGSLVLRVGIEHSDLVRGIVSVDGLPVFPTLAQATSEQRVATASKAADQIAQATPAQFAQMQEQFVRDYVTDPALAKRVAGLCAKSDPKTVAAYYKDLLSGDLRPALPKLTAPTLVIAPNPGLPLPSYLPAQMANLSLDDRRVGGVQFYTALFAGAPNLKIASIDNARHFVMLDQPQAFAQAVDGFLAALH
jgi:pimeloyl-ACP methyl ester carboxylesterase